MKDESIRIDNLSFCSLKLLADYFNKYRREFQSGLFKFRKIRYDEEHDEIIFDLVIVEENLAECQKLERYRKVIDIDEFVKKLKEEKENAKD